MHINKYLDYDLFNMDQFDKCSRPSMTETHLGHVMGFTWGFTSLNCRVSLGSCPYDANTVLLQEWIYHGTCYKIIRKDVPEHNQDASILTGRPVWVHTERLDALKEELRLEKRAKSLTGVLSI